MNQKLVAEPWLGLLTDADRDFIAAVRGELIPDPGLLTMRSLRTLPDLDRERYAMRRTKWHRHLPIIRLSSRNDIYEQFEVDRREDEWSRGEYSEGHPVSVLDGPPGVGKSTLLRAEMASSLALAARSRWLEGDEPDAPTSTYRHLPTYRPVIRFRHTSASTVPTIVAGLLGKLGRPVGPRPHESLALALQECRTSLIVFDEVQRVNFDRKTGQHVHGLLRELSEAHSRLILAGNDARWMLERPKMFGATFGTDASADRWIVLRVNPLEYIEPAEKDEWRQFLAAIEQRVRLCDLPEQGWLCEDLADYLYVLSEGRFNTLLGVLKRSFVRAIQDGSERVTRPLLERARVEWTREQNRRSRTAELDDD